MFLSEIDDNIDKLKRSIVELSTSTSTVDAVTGYPAPRISTRLRDSSPSRTSSLVHSSAEVTGKSQVKRMGKAPPVDNFHGEGRGLKFDEWLPTFERAATWNACTEGDRLLQLAGTEDEKQTMRTRNR